MGQTDPRGRESAAPVEASVVIQRIGQCGAFLLLLLRFVSSSLTNPPVNRAVSKASPVQTGPTPFLPVLPGNRLCSAANGERGRQLLIFHSSIIFVFPQKTRAGEAAAWARTCSRAHPQIRRVCFPVGLLRVCVRPNRSEPGTRPRACAHKHTCAPRLLQRWPRNRSRLSPPPPLANWVETGRWTESVCLHALRGFL